MTRFMVLYLAPASVIADWMKTDPEHRKAAEEAMRDAWIRWAGDHATQIKETGAGGKTKRVTTEGTADTKNEIMLYAFFEAETHEAAAACFATHPHLGIPRASIEIMEVRPMGPALS